MYLHILLFRAIAFIKDMLQKFQNQLWPLAPVLDSGNGIFQRCTWLKILHDLLIFRNILKHRVKAKKIDFDFVTSHILSFLPPLLIIFPISLSPSQAFSHKIYSGKLPLVWRIFTFFNHTKTTIILNDIIGRKWYKIKFENLSM